MKYIVTAFAVLINLFSGTYVGAIPSPSIVISQVQAGAVGAATQEFVSLFNNSSNDVNVSGWCLTNKSVSTVKFACVADTANIAVFIRPHSHMTIASDAFSSARNYQPDVKFTTTNQTSGSIVGGGDTLSVIDKNGTTIDSMNWTSSLAAGSLYQRGETSPGSGTLIDTDTLVDFTKLTQLVIPNSGVYEVETIIDVCPNIAGAQTTIPDGLIIDASGNCVTPPPVDTCPNINGLQLEIPVGFLKDADGHCQVDKCENIEGLQTTIPNGYQSLDGVSCTAIPLVSDLIEITELLPNPAGSDTGNEFIELRNPNLHDVNLAGYALWVGPNFEKNYQLPSTNIGAGQYMSFTSAELGFTFVNSSSRAKLVAPAGNMVAESAPYLNPADGESWALINGAWQFTNQLTPGAVNVVSLDEESMSTNTVSMAPCPEGKYRNPLTNRCRTTEADASMLASCDSDQYRNPETGRCRKVVVAAGLAPCKDGQYRSEETNRCRNISTASADLAPCKEGQERNPDTNRCRNVAPSSVPGAAFAVEPVKQGLSSFVGWWALAVISILALGYGIWEWRYEIVGFARRVKTSILRK